MPEEELVDSSERHVDDHLLVHARVGKVGAAGERVRDLQVESVTKQIMIIVQLAGIL